MTVLEKSAMDVTIEFVWTGVLLAENIQVSYYGADDLTTEFIHNEDSDGNWSEYFICGQGRFYVQDWSDGEMIVNRVYALRHMAMIHFKKYDEFRFSQTVQLMY